MSEYRIYHIKGVKIGCTNNINRRMREQGFTDYKVLEIHTSKDIAGQREFELQKQYGYKVDNIRYSESVRRINKASEIAAATKHEWLPNVDWKAREEKIDQNVKWDKIKSHPNYINRRISNGSEQLKKVIIQYDLDGNFIKEWNCGVRNMPDEYKNAGGCAKTNTGTLYGYQWRYKESNDYPKKINKFINKMHKKVVQKDMNNNIIKIWDNQTQAANYLGCSVQLISRCQRGLNKTAKGFKFERYEK